LCALGGGMSAGGDAHASARRWLGSDQEVRVKRDPGLELLADLMEASHGLPPDEIVAAITRAGKAVDAEDVAVYLVDYEQTVLVPLPDGTDRAPLDIDTTLAGRAFTAIAVQEADSGAGRRLWLPLLDGAERLGVLGLTLPRIDDPLRKRCTWLATLVAELILSKNQYTDSYSQTRRRQAMGLAAEMQWQLLPPLTFVTPRVVIAGLLEPAYEVAGDAFDYALNGDIAHLAVIDPVGHDLTASVLAAVTLGAYRHSRRARLDLAATHAAMDATIAGQFGGERFVTGQLAQLDCGTGQLQWVNAGHPLPLLVRGSKVVGTLACQPVPPLGLGFGQPKIATAALEPADRVLFYTDGVVEGRNLAGEPFGEARLADLLIRETLAGQPAAETMRRLAHAILAHQGTSPRDDATMVFLEWPGVPPGEPAAVPPHGRPATGLG
jgi:serine phosphatase RsbU (regulator of sigma subunit)